MKRSVQIVLLSLILLLALLLRIWHYTGPIGSDDHDYYLAAYDIYQGAYQPTENYWKNRFAMILPITASYAVLGTNEYAAAAWPMLSALGAIAVCFFLGKSLVDARAGLLGGLLLAFYPLDIHYSGLILPDIPLSFLMAASVLAFLRATEGGRFSLPLFFTSGLLMGVSYSARSMSIILLPFFLVYAAFFVRKIKWGYALFALGGFAVLALEGLYYHLHDLSPFYNLWLNKQAALEVNASGECSTSQLYYPQVVTRNLSVFGPYFYLFVPALLLPVVKRERGPLILALWAGIILLILQFGIVSLSPLIHVVKVRKFLNYATVPLILLSAWALLQLRLRLRIAVVVLVAGLSLYFLRPYRYSMNSTPETSGSNIRQVARYLAEAPPKPIYADPRTQAMLTIFSEFSFTPERFRNLYEVKSAYDLKNCYVVINGYYAQFDSAKPWVPRFVGHYPEGIPGEWVLKDFYLSGVYTVP
ncbi:MAG: phospholipid carrier-dependent glycosyltransferase [Candidatus Abyssobacteria bacterium SURF_5]|uniref:Phospholipid carrier-dependent glycosyltransferase n=1 Tax=Abyssobacteria bacterium (strain SURF_5) TaxID=2093360 RepID=A0A3A4P141_ABYX5|nr:MAG: phospholipid carrier-dependent glycosyltransferase [Candidatus Abyssubacteria bacterium SURF_5]